MGDAGLYYYYHTFATALNATGKVTIKDAKGVEHDWRSELIAQLGKEQKPDGSWKNKNEKWFESNNNLATAFALLSLSYCK